MVPLLCLLHFHISSVPHLFCPHLYVPHQHYLGRLWNVFLDCCNCCRVSVLNHMQRSTQSVMTTSPPLPTPSYHSSCTGEWWCCYSMWPLPVLLYMPVERSTGRADIWSGLHLSGCGYGKVWGSLNQLLVVLYQLGITNIPVVYQSHVTLFRTAEKM